MSVILARITHPTPPPFAKSGLSRRLHADATEAVNTPPPPRHQPDDAGTVSRAEGLAKRGSLRRAVLALESTPVCTPCPAILHQLREKHPPADNEELTWPRASTPNLTITHADFVKLLSRCENGVGAGPSGTTFEHLRDASITNATVCTHLHALVNTLLAGNLPGPVADLLTASRLIALSKPGGGARPIAIGECMTRLTAKVALTVMGESAQDHFLPLQYGVAVPGGAEEIIHAARSFTDSRPQCLVLQTDIANAFNSISQQAIIEAIQDNKLSPLLPLVKLTYGNPSQLLLDANFDSPPLSSERGVRQGDPLGPLLFAAGIHPALRETAAAHPEVLCLAYADDVTFMGEQEHTVAAFTFFTDKLAHLGLAHNPEKCAAWSSAIVETSQLPPGVPFSKEGVRLIGSYLGPATGAANFLAGQLEEMTKPLPLLERADPQVASLLLTRCISRRVAYITRTTPLNLLSRNTWSQWGRDLLATLLTSCGIRVPSCSTEHSRVWAQALLPPSLGGIGLTDPLVEGVHGFLASFTQAALFLTSLTLPPDSALAQARNHMLLPRDVTSPLHTWLTECELNLPTDARELLEKERLARPNPLSGHTQRLFSLTGYGTGDWLTAIPIAANRRIGPVHFANAVRFRLGLPFSTPANCDCMDQTAIPDPRLPNHLFCCGTGKHRINTHNELRDACISMAQDAGFIVHSESADFCPIEEQTADFTMSDRSSGAVWVCDVTITDPISTRDPEATRGRGWAAREQADKKIKHYANRPETVGFFPLAVETYGCPCVEVPVFLKLLADTAARRNFNADSKSFQAAKFLHQFRQRWSVALQRAQSVGYQLKSSEAAAAENPPVGGIGAELYLGDCFAVIEPLLEI
ncbi:unnamed protein product [Closterium sp. NIES-53]